MYLFNFIRSNKLFQTLPESYYIAQSQKKLWRPTLRRAGSSPRRRPLLLLAPFLLTINYSGEKLSGGGKIMRRQNNYTVVE